MLPDAQEDNGQSTQVAQSHCWQVSVNLVRAFKEALSNWLDLDLFVVEGRLKLSSRSGHLADVVKSTKGLIAGNRLCGLADGPGQRECTLLFSLTNC